MKIFNKIRSLGRKSKIAVAVVTLGVALTPFVVDAGFFPGRPTFDYNKAGNGNCSDPNNPATQNGRCGSMTGPVFNSFVNTPSYGDEREFLDAKMSDQTTVGSYADPITNVTEGTREVVLRMYIHNNANTTTNASGTGIARNTRVAFSLPNPGQEGNVQRIAGYISADNATPGEVADTVDLSANKNFTVAYKPGSAKLHNNGPFANGIALPDSVVNGGTQIGWDALNGNFPGCFEYDAQVAITVVITPKELPNMALTKQVRKTVAGQTGGWVKEVNATPGEKVDWLINTQNNSQAVLTDVVSRDVLPPHVEYVPGSLKFVNARLGSVPLANPDPLFGDGYNSGRYEAGDNSLITFTTVVKGDFEECQKRVRNVAYTKSKEYPTEVRDDADVVITREDCDEDQEPLYKCDSLTAQKLSGRTVKFTANATAINGAEIERYIFNYGDGSQAKTTTDRVVEYTYPRDGQFAARVQVQVRVGNQTFIAEGDQCAAVVNYTSTPTPPTSTTPGQPTKLPETGAGSAAITFIAVTTASTVGYYIVARRAARI